MSAAFSLFALDMDVVNLVAILALLGVVIAYSNLILKKLGGIWPFTVCGPRGERAIDMLIEILQLAEAEGSSRLNDIRDRVYACLLHDSAGQAHCQAVVQALSDAKSTLGDKWDRVVNGLTHDG